MTARLRRLALATATTVALAAPAAAVVQTAAADAPRCAAPVTIALAADWAHPRTRFRGWGTSLAWFASTTGGWVDPVRERLADLLYGPDGLGWTIARYNIGGGRRPGTPPLTRPNANIPGMWKMPAGATGRDWWRGDDPRQWDWSADPGQQWWLDAVRRRVPADVRVIEAAAYSPPWFMTVSGDVAGAGARYQPNLRPGFEPQFADYLVRAMQGLERRHAIRFHSIAPLNEPNTPYWVAGNRQEGNYVDPAGQARLLLATARSLAAHRSTAMLSAMDETNHDTFVKDWTGYPAAARAVVRQLNVHSYSTTGATGPRDIAAVAGLPLWMSEVDLSAPNSVQDFEDRSSALALGEQIVLDLKRLEPAAWVIWQAVEPSAAPGEAGSNWGLLRADMSVPRPRDMTVHLTAKYWAMAGFSRHVRPGDRLVRNDDPDTVTALSADARRAVVVHVNHGPYARRIDVATSGLPGRWAVGERYADARRGAADGCAGTSALARERAITTLVLRRRD
ncbi:glycosyl hydrolase [Sphingomonas sp. RRHST34]|uniref:Glycosyl hydrolase n=1 Tax=Sphingomonas citri TaxID=2862499 RepID=A0ABS7BSH2_9SPHN|nr:glycoside hydrolase [Sphingomonas citri]MBW6532523.1 glycosyl hydrolase [Sphingomonas citri]